MRHHHPPHTSEDPDQSDSEGTEDLPPSKSQRKRESTALQDLGAELVALSRDQLAGGRRTIPLLAVNLPRVRLRAKLLDAQIAIHALRGYGSYFATAEERQESGDWDEPLRPVDYNLVPGRQNYNSLSL